MPWSHQLFRLLLRVYPRHIREKRGDDMWYTFASHLRDARVMGRLAVLAVWRREIIALWRGAHRARVFEKEQYQQKTYRPVNTISWLGNSTLDFRLGVRMLRRYPGLTVIGVFAMSIAIGISAGAFEFYKDHLNPKLPLDDGERIVGLWNWDVAEQTAELQSFHDYLTWRSELSTIQDVGAAESIGGNLITADGNSQPVVGAAVTASTFRLLRVPPLLGRPLVDEDENTGSPSVIVIGFELWQSRFGGTAEAVGQSVRLGQTSRTVVGVMPQGFGFPYNHEIWVPLQTNSAESEPLSGPFLQFIFGRLAPNVTLQDARTELAGLGKRSALTMPETHEHLRPRVAPYAASLLYRDEGPSIKWTVYGFQFMWLVIVLVACVNVATLVFARTAAREREIVVRHALGASRTRIVRQLFVEALILASIAGAVGLVVTNWGTHWALGMVRDIQNAQGESRLPFWWNDNLSITTVGFAGGLVLFAAVVTGVLPALKVTGGRAHQHLQNATGPGLRFGVFSTALIVVQVAASVALLTTAFGVGQLLLRVRTANLPFPSHEFISARLEMDPADGPSDFPARYANAFEEVQSRVASLAGVKAVTYADRLPAMRYRGRWVETDARFSHPDSSAHYTRVGHVAPNFFEVLTVQILSGRGFHTGDAESNQNDVIVNQSFADLVFGDQSPVGHHVRYAASARTEASPWYQVVGVVPNLGMHTEQYGMDTPGLYRAVKPDVAIPIHIVARVVGATPAYASQLRRITAVVDPEMEVHTIQSIARILEGEQAFSQFVVVGSSLVAAMVLLLSAAGTYALMSFTVSQRTREIGIRTALGANPQRILQSIFRRAVVQLALGVVAGATIGIFVAAELNTSFDTFLPICGIMGTIGILACAVPARRALAIQPTDALREDG